MKIRIFKFGVAQTDDNDYLTSELRYIFNDYLTDNDALESFSGMQAAAVSIAKAFSDSHIVMFYAAPGVYAETKQLLAKAFNMQLVCDERLLGCAAGALGRSIDSFSDDAIAHAYVPQDNSRVFALTDGLYSGYALVSGNQTIILLPFEKERTQQLLSMQVLPFINAVYSSNIDLDGLKRMKAEHLAEVCKKEDIQIAVSATKTASFFREYVAFSEALPSLVCFTPRAEARGSIPPVDYVVNLSITAAELMGVPYGVAISNAFFTGDTAESEKIVYMAVTNDNETAVREIHSVAGEDVSGFLTRCCGDLCMFIADMIEKGTGSVPVKKREKNDPNAKIKNAIAGVLVALILLSGGCAAYFYANGYTFTQWYENNVARFFSSDSQETSTQASETTTAELPQESPSAQQ